MIFYNGGMLLCTWNTHARVIDAFVHAGSRSAHRGLPSSWVVDWLGPVVYRTFGLCAERLGVNLENPEVTRPGSGWLG